MIQLVIFAGQSNLGLGMSAATLPDHLKAPIAGTYMFTSASTYWGGVTPGAATVFPNNPGTWGAADQFAYDFHQAHPDDVLLIVQVAHGSTGIAADAGALDWSPASHDEMFDLIEATLARALAALPMPTPPAVSAVFFVGMETDATDAAKAAHAGENLDALTDAIRDRLMHDPNGYVGMTRISDTAALSHNEAVRVAQWSADQADDHLSTFKTVGLERQADDLHMAGSAHVAIGDAFSSMFEGWF